ncbi:MAG TPA: hypothetical protein VI248_14440 [Kineosporiaceae bacterium]
MTVTTDETPHAVPDAATPPTPAPSPGGSPADAAPTSGESGPARDGAPPEGPAGEEAEQLQADGVHLLRTLTDDRPGGIVYISAHTVNAENIAARDVHGAGARRGGHGRGSRSRVAEERDAPPVVSVTASSDAEMARLRAVTMPVDTRQRAAPLLAEERLLILHGPAGAGKRAAAIDLLQPYGTVLDVDPSVSVNALAAFDAVIRRPEHPCYVIESLAADTARALTDYAVRSLARQLEESDARLVVTVDERIPLQADVAAGAVSWNRRPDPIEALRRHLDYYLAPGVVDQVMRRLPLDELKHQLAEREMRLVDRLARQVAQAHRDGRDVVAAVRDLGLEAHERVRRWFAEERTPLQVALLLAATVLHGCTFASVLAHAARMEGILAELCRIDLDDHARTPTRDSTAMLAEVMATTAEGMLITEFGTCVTRLVRLESEALLPAVLDVVWHDHDLAAETLVRWLVDTGRTGDGDVRLRVAMAAGRLADIDFATIRNRILLPWAKDPSRAAGWAAADALGVPAGGEGTAPLALGLLHHWATVDNLDMAWTAVAAFGGYVGLKRPGIAMQELRAMTDRHAHWVLPAVRASVVRLFCLGALSGQDVPTLVLAALCDWLRPDLRLDHRQEGRRADGGPAPEVACTVITKLLEVAGNPADSRASRTWERLTHRDALPAAVRLLREALRRKTSRDDAADAVLGLVDAADQNDGRYPALESLLLAVPLGDGGTVRDGDRLRHYLAPWTRAGDPSPSAVRLLERLPRGDT